MKIILLIPAPYPEWLAQEAPATVSVEYGYFVECRAGGLEVNWIEVGIGVAAPYAIKTAWDFLARFHARFPIKIKTDQQPIDLTYEAFEGALKKQAQERKHHGDNAPEGRL